MMNDRIAVFMCVQWKLYVKIEFINKYSVKDVAAIGCFWALPGKSAYIY